MLNGMIFESGSSITIVVNALLLACVIYYGFIHNDYWNKFLYLYLYLAFLLLLIIVSSTQLLYSFSIYLKFIIGLLAFPLGFFLFGEKESVSNFWKFYKTLLVLFIINYIISNIFHFNNRYSDISGTSLGNIFEDGPYINICIATTMPIFLSKEKWSKYLIVPAVMFALVLGVVLMKRTTILCMIVTGTLYWLISSYLTIRYKGNYVKKSVINRIILIILGTIALGTIVSYYQGKIVAQFEARANRFQSNSLQKEARTLEWKAISDDILHNNSMKVFLLGKETFNVVGTYGNGKFGKRNIHDNYGIILNGTGIVGFVWYFFVNFYILFLFFKYSRRVDLSEEIPRKFYIAFLCIWSVFMIAGMSNTIYCHLYSSIHYATLGMMLRFFYDYDEKYQKYEIGNE